jgi:hypothetical protein
MVDSDDKRFMALIYRSISTDKRHDSIGSAPAGVVGVGSTLIPGHFRLGRLDEAAGVCSRRGPSMGFEWVPDFGSELTADWRRIEFCSIEQRSLCE